MDKSISAYACQQPYTTQSVYQYDRGIRLVVDGLSVSTAPNFHFGVDGMKKTLTCKSDLLSSGKISCMIPDVLMMQSEPVHAYVFIESSNAYGYTACEFVIPVIQRAKPSEVVYTEAEINAFDELMSELTAARDQVQELLENTQGAQDVIADGAAVSKKLLGITMSVKDGCLYVNL